MSDTIQDEQSLNDLIEAEEAGQGGPPRPVEEPKPREEPRHEEPQQDEAERAADELRRQAEQYRRQMEQARSDAEQARQQAHTERQQRIRTEQSAEDSNYTAVMQAIAAKESDIARLQAAQAAAYQAGDYDAAAKMNADGWQLGGELAQLKAGKDAYEVQRQQRLSNPEPQRQQSPQERTTVGVSREQFMADKAPAVREWLRSHDEFFSDPQVYQIVGGAAARAERDGIKPTDPEYISRIEEYAGMSDRTTDPPARQPRNGAPSTPPSREPARQSREGPVRLSPAEMRAAQMMRVSPAEYAKGREEAKAAGEWPYYRR